MSLSVGDKRGELRRSGVRLHKPDDAILEISEQLGRVIPVLLARPNHSRVVDVGGIIDPFVHNIMVAAVSNNREMTAGMALDLVKHLGTLGPQPLAPVPHADRWPRPY